MNTCDKCGAYKYRRDNKKLIGMISGAVGFLVFYLLFQQLFFKSPSFDRVLMKTASELNVLCPIMIDGETRLDNTMALPANVFLYNYTLISIDKESVDTIEAKKYLEPTIINNVRTHPDLKYFRDNKVTMKYCYKDKDGNYLLTISVTPEQYK